MGPLETVQMVAPGVAEVVFKHKDDALEAYKRYNQRNLDGQPMVCRLQPTSRIKLSSGAYSGHRWVWWSLPIMGMSASSGIYVCNLFLQLCDYCSTNIPTWLSLFTGPCLVHTLTSSTPNLPLGSTDYSKTISQSTNSLVLAVYIASSCYSFRHNYGWVSSKNTA